MLLLTIWGTGGKEAMGKLEIVSSPCHPHMDVSIHAQTCVWACAHVWSHIEMSQEGSLGSCHTPAGTGLDCRLYHVWARARQSFSGSAKDSSDFSGFGFRMGNTRPRAERPGEVRESFKSTILFSSLQSWRETLNGGQLSTGCPSSEGRRSDWQSPSVVFRRVPHHPPSVDCEPPMLIVLGQNLVAVAPSDLTKDYFWAVSGQWPCAQVEGGRS